MLRCLVSLIFNYRYGLRTVETVSFDQARQWMEEAPRNLRCVVLIQKKNLGTDVGLSAFDLRDNPLFALVPKALAPRYIQQTKNLRNGHVVAWETAFRDSGRSLGQLLGQELEKSGHTRLLEGLEALPAEQRHEFVEQRLQGIGKLVIGVYFWDHFALIMGETVTSGKSFRDTERRLGDVSGHDEIGQLVLTRSDLSPLVCDAVGLHHDLPVACLRRNHQRTGTEFPTGARFGLPSTCAGDSGKDTTGYRYAS